jgi:hypothetical protein
VTSPTPTRNKPRQLALWVFLGVVALAVIGSGVGFAVARATAEKPADVARGYLQALADADAAKALSYTSSVPVERSLLTDAVLADSRQRAPLTDVSVSATPGYDDAVDVHYRLGDQPVDDHYTLTRVSRQWKLDKVSEPVNFMPIIDARIPVLVNGTLVDTQATEAFPVSYRLTTGLPSVDWGENSTSSVTLSQGGTPLELEPRVTEAGKRAFLSGARKAIATCTGKRDLAPDGCPFGFRQPSSGPKIPNSTVRWKVKGDPLSKLGDPELSSMVDPGTAKARATMTFTCTCRFSTGQACKPSDVTNPVVFVADVTKQSLEVKLSAY